MTVPNVLHPLVGNWTGLNRLWLSPDEPARESETTRIHSFDCRREVPHIPVHLDI